jgi:hypothetical protein
VRGEGGWVVRESGRAGDAERVITAASGAGMGARQAGSQGQVDWPGFGSARSLPVPGWRVLNDGLPMITAGSRVPTEPTNRASY